MRSLLPLPMRRSRRGLGALAVSLLTLTTGCAWITGVPNVSHVAVSVAPGQISAGGNAVATATVFDDDKIVQSTRIRVGYESSDPSIATINPTSGAIVGIAPGTVIITAKAKDKAGTDTLVVTDAIPSEIDVTPVNLNVGNTVTLSIVLRDRAGQIMPARDAVFTSSNLSIVAIEGNGRTDGTVIRGIQTGSATITINVNGQTRTLGVTVFPRLPERATLRMQKGVNRMVEGEVGQTLLELFGPNNTPVSNAGQSISYSTEDPTVATVNGVGVVSAIRPGTTVIRATIGGVVTGTFNLTVIQIPTTEVRIVNRTPFIRIDQSGAGVPSVRLAVPLDSIGRQISNRQVQYRSTDPSVFQVSQLGTVVAQKLGSARLIASADGGAVADTIPLTVTPVPIAAAIVNPLQLTILPGQTQQFTVTLTDSLGATVTGRTVNWFSTSPTNFNVNQTTGLGTALGPGVATVNVVVDAIPGFPGAAPSQGGSVLVLPTPIAKIDITPATVEVKVGQSTLISIIPRDAAGNQLFGRTGSISAQSTNPAIAIGNSDGTVRGLTAGTTTITYQAVDGNLNPQGAPTTITVNVTTP